MTAQLAVWEFTVPHAAERGPDFMKTQLRQLCKKWVFQLEEGDTGYLHYQGRGSLIKRRRLAELLPLLEQLYLKGHWTPTVTQNMTSEAMYCMKADTRKEGPWTDKDEEIYVPVQYRVPTLLPFQQTVVDMAKVFDYRTINLIIDEQGERGKTILSAIGHLKHNGLRLPPVNDRERLLATVCDILRGKNERHPGPMFLDLPRALDKRKLTEFITACEEIKAGHVADTRYGYRDWWFDSPPVWVFTNIDIDRKMLTASRWKVWRINAQEQLVPA